MPMAQQALKLHAAMSRKRRIHHRLRSRRLRLTSSTSKQSAAERKSSNAKTVVRPGPPGAMYLVKELTQASLPEIGRAFGNKHHTTVISLDPQNRGVTAKRLRTQQDHQQSNRHTA